MTYGTCNGCGACCKTIKLDQSPDEIQQMAALTRVLGIPSDHPFVAEHWRHLSRAEALAANPFYVSRFPADAHFYTCDQLGNDGRCQAYDTRPLVCRGYPWYDELPRTMELPDPDCSYFVDIVDEHVIRSLA